MRGLKLVGMRAADNEVLSNAHHHCDIIETGNDSRRFWRQRPHAAVKSGAQWL